MSLKIIARDDNLALVVHPGDTLELEHERTYTNSDGKVLRKERETVLKEEIKETYYIDSAVIFKFRNVFGMKRGIGGAFGEKK